MLSRTASELYWMSRYLERAENIARMLDVTWNLSMVPASLIRRDELAAPLMITGSREIYLAKYDTLEIHNILHFFALDEDNPGSIFHCVRMARENAHAVRGRISAEVWESLNATWIEMQQIRSSGMLTMGVGSFFDWVKERSHVFRGACYGTIMRNDAFRFVRVGTFLERADNTARILDVRHQSGGLPGSTAVEFYRWNSLLRSVSAFEAYRELYSDRITTGRVAELLILRAEVPRSLRSCMEMICELLPAIEGNAGLESKRLAAVQYARLRYGDIDHILSLGLHEYLTDFLRRINDLAAIIQAEYLEVV